MECRICFNKKDNKFYEVQEMMFGYRDKFNYYQCPKCDCLQISDIPFNMSKYYPSDYYSFSPINDSNHIISYFKKIRNSYAIFNRGIIGRLLYNRIPNERLRFLSYISNINKKTRMLDVGCGAGSLLYDLSTTGFDNLLGIDPYIEDDILYSDKLKILKRYIQEIDDEFDLIMFHHSFEHISNPGETIEIVSRLLSQGGICLLRIPTVSSFAWEHYRENWVQLDPPRHFFLHSIESIKRLAEKANLCLTKVIYDSSSFQFWGSEQYIKGIPLKSENSYAVNPAKSIFSKEDIKRFERDARKLNLENRGDQAIFYLKK